MWQGRGRGGGRSGNGMWKGGGKGAGGGGSYRYDQDRARDGKGDSGKGDSGKGGGKGDGKFKSFGGNGGKGVGKGFGGDKGGGKGGQQWNDRPYDPRTPSEKNAEIDRIDAIFGYEKLDKTASAGKDYVGWMTNMRQLVVEDEDGGQLAACEYYFLAPDGTGFKALQTSPPYFYISVTKGTESEVESALRRKFAEQIVEVAHPTCRKQFSTHYNTERP